MGNLDNMFFTTNARSVFHFYQCSPPLAANQKHRKIVMMNEDGGDDSGSGNGCCSWLWIKKKKSNRVQNPNISVASSSETHAVPNSEGGEIVIPFDVMRGVTNNFSEQNILGRGASGTVYLGQISNSKLVAVKRMTGAIAGRADSEFEAEMAVMRTARHQNLVILLGYCLHENEKLLVYEYMPQGTLSRHIFDWADQGLEPLAWSRRLIIALDVARGVEYLHSLAQQSFIHRDLKPSHILLGDDMRAKVADFGLVRLAEGNASIERRVVGTYGYLAPEYANIGRVTTKVDVFSFGVILMELITGRKALDNSQPEDNVVIVPWFQGLDKDSFRTAIDSTIHINEETLASVDTVAQLACHCTASDPKQRPDMGHAVKVLLCLIQDWRPSDSISENTFGIDLDISLPEELEKWKAREGTSHWGESSSSLVPSFDNTDTSIPSHPFGFSGSSTSVDVLHTEKMKGLAPDDASSSRFY